MKKDTFRRISLVIFTVVVLVGIALWTMTGIEKKGRPSTSGPRHEDYAELQQDVAPAPAPVLDLRPAPASAPMPKPGPVPDASPEIAPLASPPERPETPPPRSSASRIHVESIERFDEVEQSVLAPPIEVPKPPVLIPAADSVAKAAPKPVAPDTPMEIAAPAPTTNATAATPPASKADCIPVTVYYGTDRIRKGGSNFATYYQNGGEVSALSYGTCVVTIPATHQLGQLEAPGFLGLRPYDYTKDVVLASVRPCNNDTEFVTRLQTGLKSNPEKEIFLFIHGFYNSFEDAARRTAQLAYDGRWIGHPMGIPVMYSFPSFDDVNPRFYVQDEKQIESSSVDLAQFLYTLHKNFPGVPINVIAHSMGTHLFCEAVSHYENLLWKNDGGWHDTTFSEVALEAPDEDAIAFDKESPELFKLSQRVTLYCCSRDVGIMVSQAINGGHRIGDASPPIFTLPGMTTIDATNIADYTGHEYYSRNPDVPLLFLHWTTQQRRLTEITSPHYFILPPYPH